MKLIVGLGNPGKQYERNRHNVGFQCVDLLAQRHGLRFDIAKGKAKVALGAVQLPTPQPLAPAPSALGAEPSSAAPALPQVQRVLLAKPQTFMNLAGQSVAALVRFYKVAPADLLVIFDDLDLPLGKLRLRAAGGSGGHNGMKSIIQALGTDQFPRLRIGIGRPPGQMDPADYVLQDFSPAEEEVMAPVRERAAEACEHWLAYGIEAAMNAFN
ncbi:MAG: aminoacyl-tRNA hydrolase [Caldilineales bacterium]|nr:aminoacyl-tRNA hydrolase [Caldilineales bacterium]MDW8318492.1 aminoacyl-tRNA hydrolase [Anaerolineae bacterium]